MWINVKKNKICSDLKGLISRNIPFQRGLPDSQCCGIILENVVVFLAFQIFNSDNFWFNHIRLSRFISIFKEKILDIIILWIFYQTDWRVPGCIEHAFYHMKQPFNNKYFRSVKMTGVRSRSALNRRDCVQRRPRRLNVNQRLHSPIHLVYPPPALPPGPQLPRRTPRWIRKRKCGKDFLRRCLPG